MPGAQKSRLRQQLLQGTLQEQERLVRHAASRVITAVAEIDLENGEWQDFINVLLRAANDPDVRQREVGTYLLYTGLESIGDAFMHRFQDILTTLSKTLRKLSLHHTKERTNTLPGDPDSVEVQITTMLALSRLAMDLDTVHDEPSLQLLQEAIPQMVVVLKQAVTEGDEVRTTQAFGVFQILLGCEFTVLNRYFGDLVQFMINLAAQQTLDEDARTQALSFLMHCIMYRKLKMQALRVGDQITQTCLEIACELRDASEDDDDVTTARAALGLLDVMATSLPPSQVVAPLLHSLGPYVNSPDPDRRQAGIMALGMCVEGAPEFINTQLKEILPVIMRLIDDSDAKVQRAAMEGVMRLAEELPEELGKEHQKLMPTLVKQMDIAAKHMSSPNDKQNLDIIRTSVTCIAVIVEGLEPEDIKPYLSELILRLSKLVSGNIFKLKLAAISAIGAIAACAEEEFQKYFVETITSLWQYVGIQDSTRGLEYVGIKDSTEDQFHLRSLTCDAMANMALAVGPELFQHCVQPLMQATAQALLLDHPQLTETSFLFWAKMAKVYKNEFKPFLEDVKEALFKSLEAEKALVDADPGEETEDLADKTITIGGKKIKISALTEDDIIAVDDIEDLDDEAAAVGSDNDWDDLDIVSAVDQEKEIAVEVLGDILTHATQSYKPYLPETVRLVVSLLEHSYEGVQKAAISTLFRAYTAFWELQPDSMKSLTPGLPMNPEPSPEIKELGELIMTPTLALWEIEDDGYVRNALPNVICILHPLK